MPGEAELCAEVREACSSDELVAAWPDRVLPRRRPGVAARWHV